ncbi:hypothetical protein C0J52_24252 [Blattella germanica]|nr:hypothetical protein C0J52_24252 [Blattella germanica]
MASKALVGIPSLYSRILLSTFPQNFSFCFAYGSGVFKQAGSDMTKNMIDMVFTVEDPSAWHKENISRNPSHYSSLHWLGYRAVAHVQENWGAKVYFNALVPVEEEGVIIKYGVISRSALVADLLDWSELYLAGRLHKPVQIIHKPSSSELRSALQLNLHSAVHTALLMLPEHFSETELYITISGLSYSGDFRMTFGEDKKKVEKIVLPQIESFRTLYTPVINSLHNFVEVSKESGLCSQDASPLARIHHLNQLPRTPQRAMVRLWNRDSGKLRQDIEDALRAIAYDPDCGIFLEECIRNIMSNFIGPALPPHLQKKYEPDETSDVHSQVMDDSYGPSLPSTRSESKDQKNTQSIIGPSVPSLKTTVDDSNSPDTIGPMLPHLENKCFTEDNPIEEGSEDEDNSVLVLHADISDEETYRDDPKEDIYGPVLPPGLKKIDTTKSNDGAQKSILGPNLPPGMKLNTCLVDTHESSDSDSDIVGPLPAAEASESGNYIQNQLNERALRMKRKLAGEDSESNEPLKRESWMLELPPDRAAEFGLGPRQFRARAKPDAGDRSVWTDTPADRLKKKHSDKEKEEGKREERRPFDRNVDLQANRFDEAQKKAIFKKAQLLNDRFSSGQSKFL